jgi:hypothetical protein
MKSTTTTTNNNDNNSNNNNNPTQLLPDWFPPHIMYDSNGCIDK